MQFKNGETSLAQLTPKELDKKVQIALGLFLALMEPETQSMGVTLMGLLQEKYLSGSEINLL